jgi:hypothetical protein
MFTSPRQILRDSISHDLAGLWTFDNASGRIVNDLSPYSNDLMFQNGSAAVLPYGSKIAGPCHYYDGTSARAQLMSQRNLLHPGVISAWCWFYPTAAPSFSEVVAKYLHFNTPTSIDWMLRFDSQKATWYVGDGTNFSSTQDAGTLPLNQWNQMVGTWNGAEMAIHANGTRRNVGSRTTMGNNASQIYIGASQFAVNSSSEFFTGFIAAVGIWRRVLSQNEIAELYEDPVQALFQDAHPLSAYPSGGTLLRHRRMRMMAA